MKLIKRILIVIGVIGFVMVAIGAAGSDCEADEKIWMSAAIIGALKIVLSRALYSYLNWIQEERAKKSRRYRRYLEMQNKMSA